MFKRIVNGVTYNTATSTLIAGRDGWDHDERQRPYQWTEELYQTRRGVFWTLNIRAYQEERDDTWYIERLTRAQAEHWFVTREAVASDNSPRKYWQVYHNPFGERPEAEEEPDPSATAYFRLPASLKSAIEKAAERSQLSVNSWLLRCAEGCVRQDGDRLKVIE